MQGGYDAETVIAYPTYSDSTTHCDMRINERGTTGQRRAISEQQHNQRLLRPEPVGPRDPAGDEPPQRGRPVRPADLRRRKAVQTHLNEPAVKVDGYAGPQTRSRMHHPSVEGYCIMPATVPYPSIVSP
ncbi:hypothetical protein ACQEVF_22845 [Nonomuraea polychroma]|uniref:hypothetical protein n=1 Tax=Nonomuraea polychroma TaxID=46176 RepID=UPI003D8E727C